MKAMPLRVVHGSHDSTILGEIFVDGVYDTLPEVLEGFRANPPSVIDLGGNVGYFALWLNLHLPSSILTAYEADPGNYLRYREALALMSRPDWQVHQMYATNRDGEVQFYTGYDAIGTRAPDGKGDTISAVDILPHIACADIVKIDIEGGEWDVLTDSRFAETKARLILIEYHAHSSPAENFHGLILEILTSAGYEVNEQFFSIPRRLGMLWALQDDTNG